MPADNDERGGFGSLGSVMTLLVVAWTWALASAPLNDNSFFTHLATGRLILERGNVPRSDPYTYTAAGVDWVVQSWLASVAYAAVERAAGGVGLRLLVMLLFTLSGLLLWRLTRASESVVVRFLIAAGALFVVTEVWGERPYMVGVLGIGLVWLALEGEAHPMLLVPTLWIWANSQGSFRLGLVLALAVLTGSWLDRRAGHPPEGLLRAKAVTKAVALGIVVSVVGPLGPSLLLFPLKAVTQSEVLAEIIEWRSPTFRSFSERVYLMMLLVSFAAVVHVKRWRLAVPVLLFGGLSILAQRNIVMAVMVLVPTLAATLPPFGSLKSTSRPRTGPVVALATALLAALVGHSALTAPTTAFAPYPQRPVAWLASVDPDGRAGNLATQDSSGNFLEVLDGARARSFVDDRADMFPPELFNDAIALDRGNAQWREILDRYEVEVMVWERSRPIATTVAAAADWHILFSDTAWIVACRRGPGCDRLVR